MDDSMPMVNYVLADPEGQLHLFVLHESDELQIPVGWTWLPGGDAEDRFWSQGRSAAATYQAKVAQLQADQIVSDTSNQHAVVASVESRLGLDPGTLTDALPPVPEGGPPEPPTQDSLNRLIAQARQRGQGMQ